MPRLQQLRYLVAVADTLSFSRAAERCHVTQPTLSGQLKEMEEKLGVQLAERTRARVILTPIGAEIARRARSILAEVEDIREIARRKDTEASQATLHIGVVHTVGAYVLSPAMEDLRRSFPHLRLFLREDRAESLPKRLLDGVHDVLLLPHDPQDADCVSVRLLSEPLHVVLPVDHRLARLERIAPEDLAGETVLSMEGGAHLQQQIAALCHETGATQARDYEGTTLDTLRLMVTAGMGITLLPALYVRTDVMRETLIVARPLTAKVPTRDVNMVWRRSTPRHLTYSRLAHIIKDSLSEWDTLNS